MQPFTEKTIHIIQQIPEGQVMTYGQIARLAGNPRAARQVARFLHTMSRRHKLPWHRVINAKGQVAIQDPEAYQHQCTLLEMEGIPVINGRVSLRDYQVKE